MTTTLCRLKLKTFLNINRIYCLGKRSFLSQAYLCEEEWQRRLESPLIKNIKMDQYFIETDKKFGTKHLVSGIDIDLFANRVQEESELEELEHLLYRFRRTKRSVEIMDSTIYAVVRIYLQHKQYESLFRILSDRENYGIFPDLYSYNILMDTFLKENLYREAAHIAVLMMLQENFENQISCVLGLYSCQKFLNEFSLDSWYFEDQNLEEAIENKEDDNEEEETLVRVPFLRNHWFDDHFNITNPKHLIGKTFYLIGREIQDSLGRTYQLLGLAMYEKWDKAANLLKSFSKLGDSHVLLSEGVEKIRQEISAVLDDEKKTEENVFADIEVLLQKLEQDNKVTNAQIMVSLDAKLKDVLEKQKNDIELQKDLFLKWEDERKLALDIQNRQIEKERRLKVIEEKKEYLYWKEKLLFFFENEDKNLEDLKKVEELVASMKSKISKEDTYEPPEIIKKRPERLSKYKKMARVKVL